MEDLKHKFQDLDDQCSKVRNQLTQLEKQRDATSYCMKHPIWQNLVNILPKEMVEVCCEYYTFDFCVSCGRIFPKTTGCVDCLLTDKQPLLLKAHSAQPVLKFRIDHETLKKSGSRWCDIIFRSQNTREIWQYLQKTIGSEIVFRFNFDEHYASNASFLFTLSYTACEKWTMQIRGVA